MDPTVRQFQPSGSLALQPEHFNSLFKFVEFQQSRISDLESEMRRLRQSLSLKVSGPTSSSDGSSTCTDSRPRSQSDDNNNNFTDFSGSPHNNNSNNTAQTITSPSSSGLGCGSPKVFQVPSSSSFNKLFPDAAAVASSSVVDSTDSAKIEQLYEEIKEQNLLFKEQISILSQATTPTSTATKSLETSRKSLVSSPNVAEQSFGFKEPANYENVEVLSPNAPPVKMQQVRIGAVKPILKSCSVNDAPVTGLVHLKQPLLGSGPLLGANLTSSSHHLQPQRSLNPMSLQCNTIATQTDPTSTDEDEELNDVIEDEMFQDSSEPLFDSHSNLTSPGRKLFRRSLFNASLEEEMSKLDIISDGLIDETDLDDESVRKHLENVEYEEVVLRRTDAKGKLGLTLCYGTGDNIDTDIFVSEVEAASLAAMDGRIKAGDQILQINGVDVHTRNQAIELFSQQSNEITLLLARTVIDKIVSSGDIDTMSNPEEDRLQSAMTNMTIAEEDENALTDGNRGSSSQGHEKDSGISHDTDSEPELPPPPRSSSKYSTQSFATSNGLRSSGSGNELSSAVTEYQASKATSSISPMSTDRSPAGYSFLPFYSPYSVQTEPQKLYRSESEGSLARELKTLQKEMQFIQFECDRLIEQHALAERRVLKQVAKANNLVASLDSGLLNAGQQHPASALVSQQPPILGRNGNNAFRVNGKPIAVAEQFRQFQHPQQPPVHPHHPNSHAHSNLPSYSKHAPAVGEVQQLPYSRGMPPKPDSKLIGTGLINQTGTCPKSPRTRDESSSAYNTGADSCRSTPNNSRLSHKQSTSSFDGKRDSAFYTLPQNYDYIVPPPPPPAAPSSSSNNKSPRGDKAICTTPKMSQKHSNSNNQNSRIPNTVTHQTQVTPEALVKLRSKSADKSLGNSQFLAAANQNWSQCSHDVHVTPPSSKAHAASASSQALMSLGDVMYTSPQFLQQTIMLQQRLLRQAMIQQAHELKSQKHFYDSPLSVSRVYEDPDKLVSCQSVDNFGQNDCSVEWKVKRRADGTRYITKRPVRNKILRERAQKLVSERCGLSTDDDSMSELKLGRHWSREERRLHLGRAKERKRRQGEIIRRKLEIQAKTADEQNQIVEMSQKKQMKRKGHPLLDEFTTLQEFLAHGQRSIEASRQMGFLSVTTV